MTPVTKRTSELEELAAFYERQSSELGVATSETFVPPVATRELRRGGRPKADGSAVMTLVERDGVLRWEAGATRRASARRRARRGVRGAALADEDKVVTELRFEQLPPNKVLEAIENVDLKLASQFEGNYGLRRFENGRLVPVERPKANGKTKKVLLVVHGTFSNCDHLFTKELLGTAQGRALVARFDEVLTFDHPTLSVSPFLNACELAARMRGCAANVTVIAHSRGGLVTRWWLDVLGGAADGPRKAVLVGSPLAGTSLASPARLKDSLDLLTNVGEGLRAVGQVGAGFVPLLEVPVMLLKVFTSVTSTLASTPIADAAIALVPGLNAMSRAGTNREIGQLRAGVPGAARYFAIQTNFESERVGWKFWRAFRADFLKDAAADVLFPGANDLVVDSASMADMFADAGAPRPAILHDFETSDTVHHLNYFQQRETIDAIATVL